MSFFQEPDIWDIKSKITFNHRSLNVSLIFATS